MIKELQEKAKRTLLSERGMVANEVIDKIVSETALAVCNEMFHRLLMEQGNNSALRIVNNLKQEIRDNE